MAPSRSPHRISLSFAYDDEPRARTIEESVAREVGEIDDDRSRTRVDRDGRRLELVVEASDPVALRAAINTWCSLIEVAEECVDLGAASARGP